MKFLKLSAVESGTGKQFSVSVPYEPGMENILTKGTYSAANAINSACRIFHGPGRAYMEESIHFCGKISAPATYDIDCSVVEQPDNFNPHAEWSSRATPLEKAQKFLGFSELVDSGDVDVNSQYFDQVPSDLLDVVAFFREGAMRGENTYSAEFYDRLLNKEHHIMNGDVVYDIGVGMGEQLPGLSRAVGPGGKVIGIDIYPEYLIAAEKKVKSLALPNVHISFGDGRDLSKTPMRYNCADDVLLLGVLEYMNQSNASKMLDEAVMACKPKGKIIVGTAAREFMEGAAMHHNAGYETVRAIRCGRIPLKDSVFGTIYSREGIVEEFEKRGCSAIVHSYSNRDVIEENIFGEPEFLRDLPSEHFVVANLN